MDKALNYLSIARKAGLVELGEESAGGAARAGKAYLIAVASDASDHTWRRALSFTAETDQQCIRYPYTKAEMGFAVGRTELAIAAFTDPSLALASASALPDSSRFQQQIDALQYRSQRMQKRKAEAMAHKRNLRNGKKREKT